MKWSNECKVKEGRYLNLDSFDDVISDAKLFIVEGFGEKLYSDPAEAIPIEDELEDLEEVMTIKIIPVRFWGCNDDLWLGMFITPDGATYEATREGFQPLGEMEIWKG